MDFSTMGGKKTSGEPEKNGSAMKIKQIEYYLIRLDKNGGSAACLTRRKDVRDFDRVVEIILFSFYP